MSSNNKTDWKIISLVVMRMLIGWHFLYEGTSKLISQTWTSAYYLSEAQWLFRDLFQRMADNPGILEVVDFLNVWGLIAIGLSLIIGLYTHLASIFGMILLFLYYICTIPLPGLEYSLPTEGNYLIVNKILIELSALLVIVFHRTSDVFGLDKFLRRKK